MICMHDFWIVVSCKLTNVEDLILIKIHKDILIFYDVIYKLRLFFFIPLNRVGKL